MCRFPLQLVLAGLAVAVSQSFAAVEDPTRPPNLAAATVQAQNQSVPKLNSILISDQRRLAIIGGEIVSVGERTAGVELLEVEPGAVRVRTSSGKQLTLTLGNNKIHKEPK